jgi:PAS domain S-box-containing protein
LDISRVVNTNFQQVNRSSLNETIPNNQSTLIFYKEQANFRGRIGFETNIVDIGEISANDVYNPKIDWDTFAIWLLKGQENEEYIGWARKEQLYKFLSKEFYDRSQKHLEIINELEKSTKFDLALDLKAVFDTSYDVIYVSDGEGNTLRVSSASEKLWGYKAEQLVGKHVAELEKEGVFNPSITRLVMEKKEKIQTIQTTKTGRRLMVVGTPIKDENGNVTRIINTSRDITEESKLKWELEDMKGLMEGYRQELIQLRKLHSIDENLIYRSQMMSMVVTLANKVAEVDSTALILGESGVGKEVIASYIHNHSSRRDKPFIKVNCGAIPISLLESELFGYEKGAFTGASTSGKTGMFELANEGTLFLDEIGDMPMDTQVKLLRVLQDREIVRVGGTSSKKIDVRIITATNKKLEIEVKNGRFREDLYYRLNVVPILIPSLRERKEDIIPLCLHFLDKFNKSHNKMKVLSQNTLDYLQHYEWPGNVRELQNIIERLIVITEEDTIEPEHLPSLFRKMDDVSDVYISHILPLKKAKDLLESKLISMAREKYKTTSKIAEVLEVNQSTISRKLNKLD